MGEEIKLRLDKVKEDHTKIFEEIELLKIALPLLDIEKKNNYVRKIINFFEKSIIQHFEYEENNLFSMALVIGELEIKQVVRELQQEHILILSKLDKLKDIIFKYGFSFYDEKVEGEFMGLAKEAIELLLKNARKEDEELFPYLEEKGMNIKKRFA